MSLNRKKIGICGVDAGCLLVIDPCYLQYLPPTKSDRDWNRFCKDILGPTAHNPQSGGQIHHGGGAVIFSTGADGGFPVYAYYDDDNCITKVEIIIQPEGE